MSVFSGVQYPTPAKFCWNNHVYSHFLSTVSSYREEPYLSETSPASHSFLEKRESSQMSIAMKNHV